METHNRSPYEHQGPGAGERAMRDLTGTAKDLAHEAVDQGREYVENAREYVGHTVQQARDKVDEYREGGFERVKGDVTSFTRRQPMTALLVAAGVGLALGWISIAGRR